MIINFDDEKEIIMCDGLQILISKENAIKMAREILDYYEEEENETSY